MQMERIDTTINMSDDFTKGLSRALFHQHADFLLGHIPPAYSPIYASIVGTYTNQHVDLKPCVPSTFTTPLTAAAAITDSTLRCLSWERRPALELLKL
jgi:hypothetical protein